MKLKIPVAAIPGSLLCPVMYLNMIDLTPAPTYSPAFVFMKHNKLVLVTYPLFQSTLRKLINCIGRNPKQFSTHSFRLGGSSWAYSSKIPSELIQLYGDWKSDAYKNYLRFNFEDKIDISRRMGERINKQFKCLFCRKL